MQPRGYHAIKAFARAMRVSIPECLVLTTTHDPFYVGSAASFVHGRWFKALWQQFGYNSGVHLRRMHYQIVSHGDILKVNGTPYTNTLGDWGILLDASRHARYLGMVPFLAFEDRRNPGIDGDHIQARSEDPWPSVEWSDRMLWWSLPEIDTDIDDNLSFPLPRPGVEGYGYLPCDQPVHLELWIEKTSMDDILVPLCRAMGAVLVPGAGYQSITAVIQCLRRIAQRGKPARIFYLSDFDPAGEGMPFSVARGLECWHEEFAGAVDIKLLPLGLSREQVATYALPRVPIKDTDKRKKSFEAQHGEGAVELDALEALHPGELARIVRAAMRPYRDPGLRDRLDEAEEEAEALVTGLWDDMTTDVQDALEGIRVRARTITAKYKQELTRLNDALQDELAPLKDELEALQQTVYSAQEVFEVELPPRPEATIEEQDESRWLLDTTREYAAQLAVYKQAKPAKPPKKRSKP